ncbi:PBECR3 domain-containing polyvalent protein, partial [Helicobacter bizzozeronii]
MLNLKLKNNATKALIREIEGGLPPDDPPPSGGGGGGIASPHLGDSGGHGGKPPSDGGNGGKGNGDGELISKTTPTRKATKEDLTEEFLEEVKRRKNDKVWIGDLTNPKIIEHLGFDPNKPIKMLFDGDALTHIEKRHGEGSPLVESSGQPAVKLEDIQNYPDIVNHADLMRVVDTPKGKYFLAGKQINGYVAVVEAVGVKNNQLMLKTMYKERGKLADSKEFKESISNHNVADSRPLNTGDSLDTAMDLANSSTTPLNLEAIPAKATELFNTAKEQEAGFRGLLEGLKSPSSTLEASNTLKSLESIQEKLEYYKGDTSRIDDLLRGAVLTDRQAFDSEFMRVLDNLENNPNVSHTSPKFIKTQDGYTGAHINFDFKGASAEVQVHTPKSWEVKKQLDPLYKEKRRLQLEGKLSKKDLKEFKRKMKAIAQESDLDSSLLTSFKLTSPQASSVTSVLEKKSWVDLNATQEPSLNSKAGSSSESENAYNLCESKLNQKSTSLSGGKGTDSDIQTPFTNSTKPPLKAPKIEPNPAFGEHFAEFELKGAQAVAKLLKEQRGQVAGAFYREDLGESGGYIDLVWGHVKDKGSKAEGWGLSKILE